MELVCVRIAYHTLDKMLPGLFLPLEPHGKIGKNLPLVKIYRYTVALGWLSAVLVLVKCLIKAPLKSKSAVP